MGQKGADTRQRIREKAVSLFAERGFQAVTMKDICQACGLSRGGLYRHYSSTQDIFQEILEETAGTDDVEIRRRITRGDSAAAIFEDQMKKIKQEMLDGDTSLSYAIYEYSLVCSSAYVEALHQKGREKWRMLLEYGMERGEFNGINTDQMTDIILYVYQGVRMWSRVMKLDEQTAENLILKIKQDVIKK